MNARLKMSVNLTGERRMWRRESDGLSIEDEVLIESIDNEILVDEELEEQWERRGERENVWIVFQDNQRAHTNCYSSPFVFRVLNSSLISTIEENSTSLLPSLSDTKEREGDQVGREGKGGGLTSSFLIFSSSFLCRVEMVIISNAFWVNSFPPLGEETKRSESDGGPIYKWTTLFIRDIKGWKGITTLQKRENHSHPFSSLDSICNLSIIQIIDWF